MNITPSEETSGAPERVHDVLGIGFGPANLALAVALEEAEERGDGLDRLFLEAKPDHGWHRGMMLDGSQIQISVLKDLITVQNPRSRFTFLNYLQEHDRLFHFLNLRNLFPSRLEFNDYLAWVAGEMGDAVRYGRRVRSVVPTPGPERGGDGVERTVDVEVEVVHTGEVERYRARNVVVATGGRPWVPDGIDVTPLGETPRVFHSHNFLRDVADGFPDRSAPYRFVVIGSGQSAAELFHWLATHYPQSDVTATVRRFGYKPVDESDFTNEIFFPERIDWFYNLPEAKREQVFESFRDVNYAVVDHHLIQKIYRFLYDERVAGRDRARVRPYLELVDLVERGDSVEVCFEHLIEERPVRFQADGVVLCTGYRWDKEHPLLDRLASRFVTDAGGRYTVRRDYRVASRSGFEAGVYLQGYCESTHGISETVLSLLPVRAHEIAQSILERRRQARPEPAAAGA